MSIGYLLEYLYFGTMIADLVSEAKKLTDIFTLGVRYELAGLVDDIITKLEIFSLSSRIPAMQLFNIIEDVYEEGTDPKFCTFFAKTAPGLIRKLEESDMPEVLRMIAADGTYASALFTAYREALEQKASETLRKNPRLDEDEHCENGVKPKLTSGIDLLVDKKLKSDFLFNNQSSWDILSETQTSYLLT